MKAFTIAVSQITATVSNQQEEHPVRWLLNRHVESSLFVQVLNVVVETDTHVLSLVRYIPDLVEFDHLIKTHYRRVKIPFPRLTEDTTSTTASTTSDKRRSFRQFLTSFPHGNRTNAEKIQRYLHKCSLEPVVRSSSLFRDFFSVQRDEDRSVAKAELKDQQQQQQPQQQQTRADSQPPAPPPPPPPAKPPTPPPKEAVEDAVVPPSPRQEPLPVEEEKEEEKEEHQQQQEQIAGAVKKYDFFENLEMIKVLGKGCMGKVFLVRSRRSHELYALKSIVKELVVDQREITHTLAERDILATLSGMEHPFLAKLHASFQDKHRLYLVTDYYCGGDLATQMSTCSTFSKERTLFYAAEIIEGIGELHRLGVLYRDLKPENILLTADGHVVLTDFGLSKWLVNEDHATQTFCGTAEYLAPEALLGEVYSFGIDHWAYGTILYEMLAGITPFWADNHPEMYRRVLQDPLEFPPDTDFETAEFLAGLLERDPRMRLGYHGVDEIKQHIYFAALDWDDVYRRRLPPPYIPDLRSSLDFSNFDPSFLEMPPVLTPIPSQLDLSADIQHVFDAYSFVDARFLDDEASVELPPPPLPPLPPAGRDNSSSSSSGWDDELSVDHKRRTMDRIDEQQQMERELYTDFYPTFQPARKRGSVSMLSDIDSFHLDDRPKPAEKKPARHAKRRNTNGSSDLDEVAYAYRQQMSESLVVAEPLLSTSSRAVPDLSVASTADELEELDFGISADLDLKLSFSLHIDPAQQTAKPKKASSNSSSRRKAARRFFSPLLKF